MSFLSSAICNLSSEKERLILWLPVLLGVGIGIYFTLPAEPPLWLGAAITAACAATYLPARRIGSLRFWVLAAMMISVGFAAASLRTHIVATPVIYGELFFREVEGTIEDIQQKEKGTKVILSNAIIERLASERVPVRISVTLKKPLDDMQVGDRISVKAMLFEPPTPAIPGGVDFGRMFYFQQLGAVGFAPAAPTMLAREGISRWQQWLTDLRLSLAARIMAPMDADSGPVAAAMMVGESSAITGEVSDALRASGLYHVISISGLHMTLAAGLLYGALRFMLALYPPFALRFPTKKIAALLGLLGALIYLFLAGMPVPAVRSFVMVACVMLAILADRQGISMYSLAWAATLILLIWPESLLGVSFQLSFAATVAIVALYERCSHILTHHDARLWRKLVTYFLALMLTSLAATLATMPFVIYHFSRFTIWGIASNMLMMPFASLWMMPSAVAAFFAMPFGLEYWPLRSLDASIDLMIAGSRWVSQFSGAALSIAPPTFAGLLLATFGGLWLCLWQSRVRLLGLAMIVIAMTTIALYRPYDLLVSDDASKVAIRNESGEYVFLRGKPSSFDGEQWLRAIGPELGLTLREVEGDPDAPNCHEEWCDLQVEGKRVIVALKKDLGDSLCIAGVDMVISGEALGAPGCASIPHLIDKRYLWHSGALGIRFNQGVIEIDNAASYRGNRPWVARSNVVIP